VSLFRRRKSDDGTPEGAEPPFDEDVAEPDDGATLDAESDESDEVGAAEGATDGGRAMRGPTSGPFDVDDAPDEPRVDLGALRVPLVEGVEMQLQVDEASGLVTATMLVLGDSAVQLQAFAAPRSEGIWAEVSEEIAAGVTQQGGTVDRTDGPFGSELLARVPAQLPDGKVGFQPMRFTGVDGPRWLLRAVFHGRAAIEREAAAPLEALVSRVVVVRGVEPMGPRELLALQLPEGATRVDPQDPGEGAAEPAPQRADDPNPFERGPVITEIH
jgi:hypothetical protein